MAMRLIDADALAERICSGPPELIYTSTVMGIINDMPTVDAVPVRHGRWLEHPWDWEWKVCSVCGQGCEMIRHVDGGTTEYFYQYCPWCGAKMDGGENDGKA